VTKLEKELCRILDTGSDVNLAIKEAVNKEKLTGTYMFVNGNLALINTFNPINNIIYMEGSPEEECKSLEVFLPETGTYLYDKYAIQLVKKPVKNWKKSFCDYGQWIKYPISPFIQLTNYQLPLATKVPFLLTDSGRIIYNKKSVGTYDSIKNKIFCSDYTFYQELLDFSRKIGYNFDENNQ